MIIILTQTTLQTAAALDRAGQTTVYLAVALGLLLILLLLRELLHNADTPAVRALPRAFAVALVPLLIMLAAVIAVQLSTLLQ